ncbi:MAG: flagellar basal body L-ring protein FlgH [Planctomycetes bacterium]|nr:flagellar basal body L-ring protein FlgH [Planctomycetota bacterium]
MIPTRPARSILAVAAALTCAALPAQNLFAARRTNDTFVADNSASGIGDILTIRILEQHRVRNEDTVERENQTSLAARLEAYTLSDSTFGAELPRLDIRQDRNFQGDARQEKDSTFEARIAVVVIDVLPNGNLVVAGTRIVQIDDETKTLRISGLVRLLDVQRDNTVLSSQVADARVSIVGEGGNSRVATRGPVGQLFDTLIWAVWPF